MDLKIEKILRRCEYMHHGNTWGGYITPVDVVSLIDAGYKPCDPTGRDIDWAKSDKAKGICNRRWFYFIRQRKKGVWQ